MDSKAIHGEKVVNRLRSSLNLFLHLFDANIMDLELVFHTMRTSKFETVAVTEHDDRIRSSSTSIHDTDVLRVSILDKITSHLDGISSSFDGIVKHVDTIRVFKSRLNALAPISKLPPEVLAEVFLQYRALHASANKSTLWQHVSHVCRHWRMVALDYPRLWTLIHCDEPPDSFHEHILRSKQAPLTISYGNLPLHEQALATLMPRIRSIKLSIDHRTSQDSPVINSAPLLRSLELRESGSLSPHLDDCSLLSNILFGDAAPRLERLRICSFHFTWHQIFQHTNMKDLRILGGLWDGPIADCGSVESALAALQGMPHLEILVVVGYLPENVPIPRPEVPKIVLRHLRCITLESDTTDCVNFISHLDIPPDSSVRLFGEFAESSMLPASHMTRFNSAYPFQHLIVNISNAVLCLVPTSRPAIPLVTEFLSVEDEGQGPEFIISTVCGRSPQFDRFILQGASLMGVVKLTLECLLWYKEDHDGETYIPLIDFMGIPSIKSLCIHQSLLGDIFFDMLGQKPDSDNSANDHGNVQFIMPQLQELTLEHVEYENYSKNTLVTCLKERHKYGIGIQKLVLIDRGDGVWGSHADEYKNAIPLLREIVPTVIRNGVLC